VKKFTTDSSAQALSSSANSLYNGCITILWQRQCDNDNEK